MEPLQKRQSIQKSKSAVDNPPPALMKYKSRILDEDSQGTDRPDRMLIPEQDADTVPNTPRKIDLQFLKK